MNAFKSGCEIEANPLCDIDFCCSSTKLNGSQGMVRRLKKDDCHLRRALYK